MNPLSEALRWSLSPDEQRPDPAKAATLIYAATRSANLDIGPIQRSTSIVSFEWRLASRGGDSVAILIHQDGRALALSRTPPEYLNLVFIDDEALMAAARDLGLRILTAAELMTPLSAGDREYLRRLGGGYSHDLAYWKPGTVGDVLFNWWD